MVIFLALLLHCGKSSMLQVVQVFLEVKQMFYGMILFCKLAGGISAGVSKPHFCRRNLVLPTPDFKWLRLCHLFHCNLYPREKDS